MNKEPTPVSVIYSVYPPQSKILRQTPKESGIWGNYKFELVKVEDIEKDENEIVIVFSTYYGGYTSRVTRKKKLEILILVEPEHIETIDFQYLNNFDFVITPNRKDLLSYPFVIFNFVPLPWTIGVDSRDRTNEGSYSKTYDELSGIKIFKSKRLSLVSSTNEHSEFHKKRISFVKDLSSKVELDLFGYGFNYIKDKWDALAPYKYSIVIENECIEYWWSEKVTDAFLAGCYIFYWGCPKLYRWFHPETFTYIDIYNVDRSLDIIKMVVKEGAYEKVIDKIEENRKLILNHYQFFPYMSNFLDKVLNLTEFK